MTVPEGQKTRFQEAGNDVKVEFTFDARIFEAKELDVYKIVTATGAQTSQVLGVDYSVEINGIDNALTTDGGKVIYNTAPATGEESLILTDYVLSQASDLPLRESP